MQPACAREGGWALYVALDALAVWAIRKPIRRPREASSNPADQISILYESNRQAADRESALGIFGKSVASSRIAKLRHGHYVPEVISKWLDEKNYSSVTATGSLSLDGTHANWRVSERKQSQSDEIAEAFSASSCASPSAEQ